MNTDVSDAVLSEVLLANSLDKLEVLTIQACKKVKETNGYLSNLKLKNSTCA